jgi:hypothetical protein
VVKCHYYLLNNLKNLTGMSYSIIGIHVSILALYIAVVSCCCILLTVLISIQAASSTRTYMYACAHLHMLTRISLHNICHALHSMNANTITESNVVVVVMVVMKSLMMMV